MSSIQNGELLTEGRVLECQFRAQLQASRNYREQSQNRQHHGREVSNLETRKVNKFNAAGILANNSLVRIRSIRDC